MSDPIGGIARRAVQQAQGPGGDGPKGITLDAGVGGASTFGKHLESMLGEVSAAQDNAQDYIQRFVRGEPVELHQVMAASEEAGIALETLIEVRNKLTDAYRTVSSMQS